MQSSWEAVAVFATSTRHLKSSPVLHPFPWGSGQGFPAKPEATDTKKLGITAQLPAVSLLSSTDDNKSYQEGKP